MPLEFTEYPYPKAVYGALPDFEFGPQNATQQIEIGAASAASAAFGPNTRMIFVSAVSADCRIAIGPDPAANNVAPGDPEDPSLSRLLNQDGEYRFAVEPGWSLAVIQATPAE